MNEQPLPKKNHNLAIFLIVSIVLVGGVLGSMLYMSNKDRKVSPSTKQSSPAAAATKSPTPTAVVYPDLTVKEWSVKFPLDKPIVQAAYSLVNDDKSFGEVHLYVKDLLDKSSNCDHLYSIFRYADPQAKNKDGKTYESVYGKADRVPGVTKIGDYTYAWAKSDTKCGSDGKVNASDVEKVINAFAQDLSALVGK